MSMPTLDEYCLIIFAHLSYEPLYAVPYKNEVAAGADEVTFGCYTDNNSRIKKYYNGTGAAGFYWTRSPDATSSTLWRYVNPNGNATSYYASYSYGVPLGFCLKSNVANAT